MQHDITLRKKVACLWLMLYVTLAFIFKQVQVVSSWNRLSPLNTWVLDTVTQMGHIADKPGLLMEENWDCTFVYKEKIRLSYIDFIFEGKSTTTIWSLFTHNGNANDCFREWLTKKIKWKCNFFSSTETFSLGSWELQYAIPLGFKSSMAEVH